MRQLILSTVAAVAVLGAGAAPAAGIVRHASSPAGLILKGVTVPAGAQMFYLSGQIASPIDPSKKPAPGAPLTAADDGDTKTQTLSALAKMKELLAEQGYKMSDIITMNAFLVGDPKLGGRMDNAGYNEAFKMYFQTAENPETVARATMQVSALASPAYLVELVVSAAKMPNP